MELIKLISIVFICMCVVVFLFDYALDVFINIQKEVERKRIERLMKKHGTWWAYQCKAGSSEYCFLNKEGKKCKLK